MARYAETNGYERDATKPHGWRYRDYVIRSLNGDKPFDRFVLEQLAGDEPPDSNAETLTATGFYRLGPWDDEPVDPKEDRYDQLDDILSTTSQIFLGLTLGCARCHDHKFDPLTQSDYYRMVAIFSGLQRPRKGRAELDLPIGKRLEVDAELARDRLVEVLTQQLAELRNAHRKDVLGSKPSALTPETIAAFLTDAPKRDEAQKKLVEKHAAFLDEVIDAAAPPDAKQRITSLKEKIKQARSLASDLPRGYYMIEPEAAPLATHLLIRGKAANPGSEVTPAMPAVLANPQPVFPAPKRSSLRRLTLAQWIASPDNSLTARVIVNRVWQHHFGEGLVRTPSDFGRMGERPTHPELLDLATPPGTSDRAQRHSLDLLERLNRQHLESHPSDSDLVARIDSCELAYRMQTAAAEVVDVDKKNVKTREMYGLNQKLTADFGRKCLITRRLLEKGVRFVQLYSGGGHIEDTWDGHNDCITNHKLHAGETDQPIAALMADLKRTGLWEDTLIIWGGEFGRTPTSEGVGKPGRDHNPYGFSMWLSGAGVKGGQAVGATDELGFRPVEERSHIPNLHATILHLLGLDYTRLTFFYQGLNQRLTGVRGNVIKKVLA